MWHFLVHSYYFDPLYFSISRFIIKIYPDVTCLSAVMLDQTQPKATAASPGNSWAVGAAAAAAVIVFLARLPDEQNTHR